MITIPIWFLVIIGLFGFPVLVCFIAFVIMAFKIAFTIMNAALEEY